MDSTSVDTDVAAAALALEVAARLLAHTPAAIHTARAVTAGWQIALVLPSALDPDSLRTEAVHYLGQTAKLCRIRARLADHPAAGDQLATVDERLARAADLLERTDRSVVAASLRNVHAIAAAEPPPPAPSKGLLLVICVVLALTLVAALLIGLKGRTLADVTALPAIPTTWSTT